MWACLTQPCYQPRGTETISKCYVQDLEWMHGAISAARRCSYKCVACVKQPRLQSMAAFSKPPSSAAFRMVNAVGYQQQQQSSKEFAHIKLCSFATVEAFIDSPTSSWLHPKGLQLLSETFCHIPWPHPLPSSTGPWHALWPCCSACSHTHSWRLPSHGPAALG